MVWMMRTRPPRGRHGDVATCSRGWRGREGHADKKATSIPAFTGSLTMHVTYLKQPRHLLDLLTDKLPRPVPRCFWLPPSPLVVHHVGSLFLPIVISACVLAR